MKTQRSRYSFRYRDRVCRLIYTSSLTGSGFSSILLGTEMAPRNKPADKNISPELTPAKPSPLEVLKKSAEGWRGLITAFGTLLAAIVFFLTLNNKVDGLKTDLEKITSRLKDAEASVQELSKALNERIDRANERIDHLSDSRLSNPLRQVIPTPDAARKIPAAELKTRFQQASYIVNADLQKQVPQKPEVVKQIRNDLDATLKNVPLPPDVHQAGVIALAHVEGYVVFCSRAFMQGIRGVVFLPKGNMMLAGGGSEKPDLRIGAIWNVGQGEDATAFFIAPSYPPPSVFYADAPSVMTDLSILSFGGTRDLAALTLRGDNASALFFHVVIQGLNQNLAKITWLSVTFRGCIVRYNGEPLYLADVRFENCKFEFGDDPASQKVLSEIKAQGDNPVSLVAGIK
jgi:hypothetical protein